MAMIGRNRSQLRLPPCSGVAEAVLGTGAKLLDCGLPKAHCHNPVQGRIEAFGIVRVRSSSRLMTSQIGAFMNNSGE